MTFQWFVMNLVLIAGFMHELRDDAGISRLWGLISRYFPFKF